ncbi:MAG TPA: choice-of-anchor D domain-containing protein, partial [Candidatus Solibacter sp.]|nr:choice-of-anchor D domain-containing protein [Candidatus Solibacter sp.]
FQPVTNFGGSGFQTSLNGGYDAFVVAFQAIGDTSPFYSTYLGGSADDFGLGIAVDANGDAFISGSTQSGFDFGFPLANALQSNTNATPGFSTSFVSVLDPSGQNLLFSTYYGGTTDYFGGTPNDFGNAIALDSSGRIYLAGRTTSLATPDNSQGLCLINPVPGAIPGSFYNDNNGFLTIINPTNAPAACFQPSLAGTFQFSPTVIGHMSGSQGPLIFNQGSADLTSTTSFTGANPSDFPITSACPTVTAGGNSCLLQIAFAPTTTTLESATLVLTNSSAGSPFMIKLQGQGQPLATVTLTPNPLAFPDTVVNQPGLSTTLAATFSNVSLATSPVNVQSVSLGGTNPGAFSISDDQCTGQQLPGDADAECSIFVTFLPTVTGPLSATLTVTHDGAGGTSSINLTGNGIQAPPISTIPPLSLTFAPQGQGTMSTAQIVTVTNSAVAGSANLAVNQPLTFTGTNPGDFAAVGCAAGVAPGASCNISVTFTPTATGARSATLQITSNATNSPQTVGISGTGLAAPTATPSGTVTFPAQVLNTTSAPMNVTLSNTGGSPLGITGVALATSDAGDFAIFSNGCGTSLAAGANCIVALTFTPTVLGARTTQLQFTDNAAGSPQIVTINGTGATGPNAALTPPTLTFAAAQQINTTSASLPATLTNSGGAALSITSIVAAGDFAVLSTNCGVSLAANSNCAINVTFTPTAAGTRNGTLTVMDAVGTQMINITGTGVTPPAVSLSASNVPFGTQAVGVTTAPMPVTLTNTGGSPLTINAIAPSGDFAEMDNCLPSVAAGGNCTIMITFTPSGVGTRNGSIVIVDNAATSPQSITLSGTGSSNVPGFNIAAPLFFGAVLVGSTSPAQTVTITNSGGAQLTIMSAVPSGDFGVSANSCGNVAIGQNCMISVTFTPTTTGTRNGTLTITDNAPGSPHLVSLSGIGATISIAPPGGGSTTLTVTPGDTANYSLDVIGTPGLVVTLNLSCVSAAPNTRCSVSPAMVTLGGPTPPSVIVTVLTNCNPALVPPGGRPPVLPAPFAGLWVGTLALFVLLRRMMPRAWLVRAAPVLLLLLLVVTWAGCVSNPPPAIPGAPTTPAGTYPVTVSANGLNVTKQLMLTLRVI